MPNYLKLYTPQDSAIVFIDHQPQMTFGVANMDRATLMSNVTLMAKVAKEFKVPAVLTAVETEAFSGYVWPQLLDVFPGQPVVERSSMNSWDDAGFRRAVEATGRKNILLTGLWTEVCVTWPALSMLEAGYTIYVVEDCCGATSAAAQDAALSRMVQAGAIRLTTIAALLEWQRDWARREHYDALMSLLKPQAGAYGSGIEYAYTLVHKAPQSAKTPQKIVKSN
ncbi:MAG TPA: hydrolase [Burkholderiaceae bacterium]|jgi:nicotinamidase-related amidase|nr:hydrolase [Burkholderiaceae bacterium]